MAFIKGFICRSCGSSLGRWSSNRETGRQDKMCFTCGIGEFELSDYEVNNLDYPAALVAIGREGGHCTKIHPRINTPSATLSRRAASQRAADSLFFIVRDTSYIDVFELEALGKEVGDVTKAMESLIEDNKHVRNRKPKSS